jgi:hypothetical protein
MQEECLAVSGYRASDYGITNHHHCQQCNEYTGLVRGAVSEADGVVYGVEQRICWSYHNGRVFYNDFALLETEQK